MQQTEGWRCHYSPFQASCLIITLLCSFRCPSKALSVTCSSCYMKYYWQRYVTANTSIFLPAIVKSPHSTELKDCLPLSQVNQKCGGQVKAEKLTTRPKHCKGAGLRQHRRERGNENKNQNQQRKSKPDMMARGATFIQLHGMLFSWMSFNKPKVFHIQLWPILFAWKSMSFFLGQVTEQSPLLVYRGITEQVSPD